jgi:hypothetical protein
VYRAAEARTQAGEGFFASGSAQFTPYRSPQFYGTGVTVANPDRLDSLITHLVAGYDLSSRWGLSLGVPLEYLDFHRTDVRYSLTAPPAIQTRSGTVTGVGDLSFVIRYTPLETEVAGGRWQLNLLGGVKLPTGDTSRIEEEMQQEAIFNSFLPPGTPHDPLGHSIAGVHLHSLATGSGSVDGIFGMTLRETWPRWFLGGQFQYSLRTRGASGFRFGDEIQVSGGPGIRLDWGGSNHAGLQFLAVYDTLARDDLNGRRSDRTGSTAWYLGPLLTWNGPQGWSANLGVDVPLGIANNGYQNVPDYRVHAGVSWRF